MNTVGKLLSLAIFSSAFLLMSGCSAVGSAKEINVAVVDVDLGSTLLSRIGPPDPLVLETYASTGATNITTHQLSDEELAIVDAALARLPQLHRQILQQHLVRLTFLDLKAGPGSALTSRVGPDDNSKHFAITLRASLLNETLTDFLNTKESALFLDDGSGYQIKFDAGLADALTYILVHEASHVVDQVLGLTDDNASSFMAGNWDTTRQPLEPYLSSLALQNRFRGAPRIPLGDAPRFYRALSETPFVTFYATAAAPDDVAELFAWQQMSMHFGNGLTLSVLDRFGDVIFQYEPLESPLVRARFLSVEATLEASG
jgi:hypothetical protein